MDKKMMDCLFSSNSEEWATPKDLFNSLDLEFHFELDACATQENAKCKKFYTKLDNALEQSWSANSVFCNPPYSRILTGKFVEKAFIEHMKYNNTIVLLLPARTDTKWFHEYIYNIAEIRFIKGRLKFNDGKFSAPFPSMICIFRKKVKKSNISSLQYYISCDII